MNGHQATRIATAQYHRLVTAIGHRAFTTSRGTFSASSDPSSLKKTPLHDFHVQHAGKMVPFAGYLMPVTYGSESISQSHLHVRSVGGLFDVSHMLQSIISGPNRVKMLESITVADVANLPLGQSVLSLITNEQGGIEDDCIITNSGDFIYLVTNAGCIEKDQRILNEAADKVKDVKIEYISRSHSLVAAQGPLVASILQQGIKSYQLKDQRFMTSKLTEVASVLGCRVTRCGYTGEDGFEISVESRDVIKLVEFILNTAPETSKDASPNQIKLAGLGARDTLRLEAGLCLYGNDIDSTTTPVEAALTWTIAKRRRNANDPGPKFPGFDVVMNQIKDSSKVPRKRVGLLAQSSGPSARSGTAISTADGKKIGTVTSGCPSPSLSGANIAMAYLSSNHKIGTTVHAGIRNKSFEYRVTKMPFVPSNYYLK